MKGNDPRYSRVNRKKMRNRSNQLLNIMIGLVVLLIIIVGASIIVGNNGDDKKESTAGQEEVEDAGSAEDESQNEENDGGTTDEGEESPESDHDSGQDEGQSAESGDGTGESDRSDETASDQEGSGTVTIVPDDDEIIMETVINPGWQPVGTAQTGVHESKYDPKHIDWEEKKEALSYATGHSVDELIYWKIKNGGGPQKSVGIVSTRDKSEKYRVYLEWVDEKGWQPIKMDVLNTLDFEY